MRAGRRTGRRTGRRAGRWTGRRAGRRTGRQAGGQAGWEVVIEAGRPVLVDIVDTTLDQLCTYYLITILV
jgi:hypothetical protein